MKQWWRFVVACGFLSTSAGAQHFPPIPIGSEEVRLAIVATGLAEPVGGEEQIAPTDVAAFPDGSGRLAVTTLGGVVRVVAGNGALAPAPLLTVAETGADVASNGEWGTIAIAIDPDFASPVSPGRGTFYTITTVEGNDGGVVPDFGYTGPQNHQDIVTAWTLADPARSEWDEALGDSRRELFRVGQPGQAHNVVALAFGPDDMLYISSGDGGAGQQLAQDVRSIFGKIFRIDPHGSNSANGKYGVPPDNPFAGGATVPLYSVQHPEGTPVQALEEIFAYGFRSPYRMRFDRETGHLYVGDVGQSDIEEVDRVVAGGNYGWEIKEGSMRSGVGLGSSRVEPDTADKNSWSGFTQTLAEQFGLTDPVLEYDHDEGVVIVGGSVYRGSALPELTGRYVFGDLGENEPAARLLVGDLATGAIETLPVSASSAPLPLRLLSIGEDEEGELLLTTVAVDPRQGGGVGGELVAVVPEPDAVPLVAASVLTLAAARMRRARQRHGSKA